MNKGTPRIRRAVVGGLTALLAVATLVPLATSAGALANFTFTRLAGADRFETANAIATTTFGTANTVLLARADLFPDALAGNYLAGLLNAPILLTRVNELPATTRTALQTLRTKNVVILGREEAVSAAVATDLAAMSSTSAAGGNISVTRVGGIDRYETANNIATNRTTTGGGVPGVASPTVGAVEGRRTAFLARGDTFPDALAAGPVAFAANLPILLTPGAPSETLHAQAASAFTAINVEQVLVLGGEEAITGEVEVAVRNVRGGNPAVTTTRLQGADRTETARAIAEYALQRLNFTNVHVNLARGDQFPDALTGGPHGGRDRAPILLTLSATVLSATPDQGAARYLSDHCPTLQHGHIFGGPEAITPAVQADAEQRARACGGIFGNQAFQVNPQNIAFLETGQTRECTAFVTPGAVVDLQLFRSENVNVAANGQVTFVATPTAGAGTADTGNPPAVITVTSPAATPTATNQANNVLAPANGIITFTVTSDTPDTDVTAVVFADPATGNNRLDTNDGVPTEAFGIGCRTIFRAPQGDLAPPVITDARVTTPTASPGVVATPTVGAAFQLTFSETLGAAAGTPGEEIRVFDDDGTFTTLVCGDAPTPAAETVGVRCEFNAARTVLTVTFVENPTPLPGGNGRLNIPFNISSLSTGFTDRAGNPVNLNDPNTDRRVDHE